MESQSYLKADQIKVGDSYVSKKISSWIREIVEEYDDSDVHWSIYDLETGEACNDSRRCSKYAIVNWAAREATSAEMEKAGSKGKGKGGQ